MLVKTEQYWIAFCLKTNIKYMTTNSFNFISF